jgi:hypothetical protein
VREVRKYRPRTELSDHAAAASAAAAWATTERAAPVRSCRHPPADPGRAEQPDEHALDGGIGAVPAAINRGPGGGRIPPSNGATTGLVDLFERNMPLKRTVQ